MRKLFRTIAGLAVLLGLQVPATVQAQGIQYDHCFWTAWACGCASWGSCGTETCPGSGYCG